MKPYVIIFALFLFPSLTFSQILRVCYVPNSRSINGDNGYTFDGQRMINYSTTKLTDASNFGPNGIVTTSIVTVPLNDNPITLNTIRRANCNVIFTGGFGGTALAIPELNNIRSWSLEKNTNLVVVSESEAGVWGYYNKSGNENPNKPTPIGKYSTIFNGPFGKVPFFNQGGSYQGFIIGENCSPLSVDAKNRTTIGLDKRTNDIILGDIDILTDLGGISEGSGIKKTNDVLFANIWAYAVELAAPRSPEKKAEQKSVIQGSVLDKETLQPVGALMTVIGDKSPMQSITTSSDGRYKYESSLNDMSYISIKADGYEPLRENISIDKEQLSKNFFLSPKLKNNSPFTSSITIEGQTLKKGEIIVLDNIQFEQSKSDLLPEGKKALNQIVQLLQQNNSLVIELSGHTSNEGDYKENLNLSNKRVEVCKQYLIGQASGVDKRIVIIGYGSSKPKVPNDSEKNRRANRRVELKVLSL